MKIPVVVYKCIVYNHNLMSKIILFSNIKGGVGKTTLCAHFAEYLSMKGVPVVAVDADIQASLSRHVQTS